MKRGELTDDWFAQATATAGFFHQKRRISYRWDEPANIGFTGVIDKLAVDVSEAEPWKGDLLHITCRRPNRIGTMTDPLPAATSALIQRFVARKLNGRFSQTWTALAAPPVNVSLPRRREVVAAQTRWLADCDDLADMVRWTAYEYAPCLHYESRRVPGMETQVRAWVKIDGETVGWVGDNMNVYPLTQWIER